MNRVFKWLESKFSRDSGGVEADDRHTPVAATTKDKAKEENGDRGHTPTLPTLTSLSESSFEVVESTGFDPYNSGSFETSKSRSRM
jgi:hypothetical protein